MKPLILFITIRIIEDASYDDSKTSNAILKESERGSCVRSCTSGRLNSTASSDGSDAYFLPEMERRTVE